MSKNRHIVNMNIFMVNVEKPDKTVNYIAERAKEIGRAALEHAQREAAKAEAKEPEEDNDIGSSSDDDSSDSESESNSDGWGTEFEELVCKAHQVCKLLDSK